jgi:Zn-dependent peptidase ImmA (M78 family)
MRYKIKKISTQKRSIIINTLDMIMILYPQVNITSVDDKGNGHEDVYPNRKTSISLDPLEIDSYSLDQVRWIVAHEFGHHVLNTAIQHGYDVSRVKNAEFLDEYAHDVGKDINIYWNELFADVFAASILLEERDIFQEFVDDAYNLIKESI